MYFDNQTPRFDTLGVRIRDHGSRTYREIQEALAKRRPLFLRQVEKGVAINSATRSPVANPAAH
jgi:hypothetical protein